MDSASFTVAEALRFGATRAEMRRSVYRAPHYGVRTSEQHHPREVYLRENVNRAVRDFMPLIRAGEKWAHAFSHTSALLLLGCPIRCAAELHVTTRVPLQPFRRQGVYGHSASVLDLWVSSRGIPIMNPATAFLQASTLLSCSELVVAVDHLVRPLRPGGDPLVTLEFLRERARQYQGRGVRRARVALALARIGAESRMETLLRLLMVRFGLDALELQVDVHDEHGVWIGRFDMADRVRKRLVEYDGEQHRTDRVQYLKDQERLDRARAAGYEILRLHKEDVHDYPLLTVRRIADFLGLPLRPAPAHLARYLTER